MWLQLPAARSAAVLSRSNVKNPANAGVYRSPSAAWFHPSCPGGTSEISPAPGAGLTALKITSVLKGRRTRQQILLDGVKPAPKPLQFRKAPFPSFIPAAHIVQRHFLPLRLKHHPPDRTGVPMVCFAVLIKPPAIAFIILAAQIRRPLGELLVPI